MCSQPSGAMWPRRQASVLCLEAALLLVQGRHVAHQGGQTGLGRQLPPGEKRIAVTESGAVSFQRGRVDAIRTLGLPYSYFPFRENDPCIAKQAAPGKPSSSAARRCFPLFMPVYAGLVTGCRPASRVPATLQRWRESRSFSPRARLASAATSVKCLPNHYRCRHSAQRSAILA